jgi:UDP-N-acetylmuramate--alanine ligase
MREMQLANIKEVHFVGIGGYGMSALALILLKQGCSVSGSDIKESPLTTALTEQGATVMIGHRPENLGSAGLVIYSTAIAGGNPELDEAARRGLPLWHRSELLAALLNSAHGIAIAGAHGKTTTTAMVAQLLEAGGLDPTAVIGGVSPAFGSNARLGSGPYLVAEADESDSSFTRYYPRLALVTGIEPDHLEHYDNDYNRLQQAYVKFLSHLPADGIAVLCADDAALRLIGADLSCRVVYYSAAEPPAEAAESVTNYSCESCLLENGKQPSSSPAQPSVPELTPNHESALAANDHFMSKLWPGHNLLPNQASTPGTYPALNPDTSPYHAAISAEYKAANVRLEANSSKFDLTHKGTVLASDITLGVPGRHNVSNAVGALATAACLGLNPSACAPALAAFHGVGRRFELIGEVRGITVIDDYAHHPTEVKATLEAAAISGRRLICLFQPHRYSRTAAFFEEFASAFKKASHLLLHSVYPAGETPLPGSDAEALAARIRELSAMPVTQNDNITALEEEAARLARPGDLIITMGAGDITYSAPRILEVLKNKEK